MQEKYNWDLTDLFKNKEEFQKAVENMKQDLKEIQKYKGILCDNSNNLYECYNLYEKILLKLSSPITIWSNNSNPNISADIFILSVTFKSFMLGVESPFG